MFKLVKDAAVLWRLLDALGFFVKRGGKVGGMGVWGWPSTVLSVVGQGFNESRFFVKDAQLTYSLQVKFVFNSRFEFSCLEAVLIILYYLVISAFETRGILNCGSLGFVGRYIVVSVFETRQWNHLSQ